MVAAKVIGARCAEDAFGLDCSPAKLVTVFRAMARILHPDHAGNSKQAACAMQRLLELRDQADKKFEDGSWGKKAPLVAVEIRTKRLYRNVEPLVAGDLYDLYLADVDGESWRVVLKLLRDPADEDLATAEWRNLQQLWSEKGEAAVNFQRYLPKMVETAKIAVGGKVRRANVLREVRKANTIADVLSARPRGVDPRDMAWMWRRLLELLSWVHDRGLVHGAILPEHVLIRPDNHGARLVGWSCSVKAGEKVKAISAAREDWYAPEVGLKQSATPATDVYMAARIAAALVDRTALPRKIGTLLDACLLRNPRMRYVSAAEVYRRFDAVLREIYGPPSFRPFSMLPA